MKEKQTSTERITESINNMKITFADLLRMKQETTQQQSECIRDNSIQRKSWPQITSNKTKDGSKATRHSRALLKLKLFLFYFFKI